VFISGPEKPFLYDTCGLYDTPSASGLATRHFCIVGLPISDSAMLNPAKIYFFVFGILTIAGGIIGYVKAGSTPSIVAGSITGVLLLIGAWLIPEHRIAGLITVLVVSILLALQFIPKFIRTGKMMPAGMMSILSAIGLIVAIVAWLRK
jgi:uncharacterized membrane protein (UPF0136 family)